MKVTELKGRLELAADSFKGEGQWSARESLGRFLVQPKAFTQHVRGEASESGFGRIETFATLLDSLRRQAFTGGIFVDLGVAIKTIYLRRGAIVFASSNLIDDRLGEICYREDLISLEALLNTTVQVDKTIKFGQVLLREQIFSNIQLFDALCAQVVQIVRSVFMYERIYYEVVPDLASPLQVIQHQAGSAFVAQNLAFGEMFRDFRSRIEDGSQIAVNESRGIELDAYEPGTFYGDLMLLVKENSMMSGLIQFSKLSEINTLVAIMHLFNRGLVSIEPMGGTILSGGALHHINSMSASAQPELRAVIDTYSYIIKKTLELFAEGDIDFPHMDLRRMLRSLDDGIAYFLLDSNMQFSQESVHRMLVQCRAVPERADLFKRRVECLTHFAIQVAIDHLSFAKAKELKDLFQQLNSL